jgi:hypothetical protein
VSVTLELDGKQRELKFDLKAIKALEGSTGKPLGRLVNEVQEMSVSAMIEFLWAGFQHEDRGMTHNLATKLLESYVAKGRGVSEIGRAINDAVMASGLFKTPDEEEIAEGNGPTTPAIGS